MLFNNKLLVKKLDGDQLLSVNYALEENNWNAKCNSSQQSPKRPAPWVAIQWALPCCSLASFKVLSSPLFHSLVLIAVVFLQTLVQT